MTWLIPDVQSLGRVAVLMGGRSAEREISIMSGTGVLAALKDHVRHWCIGGAQSQGRRCPFI